jgi:hypothetical protein
LVSKFQADYFPTGRRKRLEISGQAPQDDTPSTTTVALMQAMHVPSNAKAQDQVRAKLQKVLQMSQEAYANYLAQQMHPEKLLSIMQVNIFHALYRNSEALGQSNLWLFCESISPFGKIDPDNMPSPMSAAGMPACYPHSLTPTEVQLSTPHHPWVDLLPWPKLRDRILYLCYITETMDDDDLCVDMAEFDTSKNMESTSLIIWGDPWDPRGWEVSVPFLRKWGWLLEGCAELLEATNYWRMKRGERKLKF